jgi:hypothetical protein
VRVSRLVLHIGLEKTGTTYLQAILRNNIIYLAEQGVSYPDFCRGREHLEFLMAGLPEINWMHRRFEIRTPEQLEQLRSDVRAGLERMATSHETSIISSERLSVVRDPQAIANYAAMCREYFDDIDVVVYLRRPDHAVGSYYGQSVKVGRTSRDVDDFMAQQGRSLDLVGIMKRWQKAFGKDSFYAWPYLERYRTGGDTAMGVLIRHLGLTPPTPEDPGGWKRPERPLNVRLSAEATEYVRLINPRMPRVRVDGRWNGPMRNRMVKEISQRFPGQDAAAPPDLLQAIVDAYSPDDIAAMARRDDDPDAALWDEWLAQPPATSEAPPHVSAEQVAALAEEIFVPNGPIIPDGAVPPEEPKKPKKPKVQRPPAAKKTSPPKAPKPKPSLLLRARRKARRTLRKITGS